MTQQEIDLLDNFYSVLRASGAKEAKINDLMIEFDRIGSEMCRWFNPIIWVEYQYLWFDALQAALDKVSA